jgi:hypothetical protein
MEIRIKCKKSTNGTLLYDVLASCEITVSVARIRRSRIRVMRCQISQYLGQSAYCLMNRLILCVKRCS